MSVNLQKFPLCHRCGRAMLFMQRVGGLRGTREVSQWRCNGTPEDTHQNQWAYTRWEPHFFGVQVREDDIFIFTHLCITVEHARLIARAENRFGSKYGLVKMVRIKDYRAKRFVKTEV